MVFFTDILWMLCDFFLCFNLLLRFLISDSILLYVSGKKRERSDDNDEEKVEHSSKKNQKEKLEKELADPQKTRN